MSVIEKAEQNLIHVYNRFPVVFEKGEGVFLYDENGKEYLDFASGIGVCSLGYGNEKLNNAIKEQTDLLLHTSNLFYNKPSSDAAEKLVKATGLKKAFFTNSGAEAIEGALKVAKRYAYDKSDAKEKNEYSEGYEVIAMNNSFHGRTKGALEITGTEDYRKPFGKEIDDVKFAEFNNLDSVKELVTDKTCAIVVECVQGEGGVTPANEDFIKGIRALCDEKDIIMICDEIQCGMGRTGKMFAYEHYGILPDIVTCAKALGCGVPVGAFVCGEKCMDTLVPGDHGTTYGGNPLVTAVVSKVFDIYEEENIVANAKEMGELLSSELEKLVDEFDSVKKQKGIGLMKGLELSVPVGDITSKAIENGLVVISAGGNVLRMLPPLIINEKNIKNVIDILKKIL
ncbi:MAG: aspartate aminotransferase family protein [Eubacterium sp.]|nr:aspartate aminotransferase family protein [Eubacterium sp.]